MVQIIPQRHGRQFFGIFKHHHVAFIFAFPTMVFFCFVHEDLFTRTCTMRTTNQNNRTTEPQNNRTTEPQNNRTTDNNQTNHQSKQKHGTGRKQQQGMIRTTKEFTAQHTGTTGPVVFGHFMFRIATTSTGVGGSTVPGHKILSQCFHFRHHLFPMFAVMNRHHFDRTYSQSRQMQRFVHHTTRPASQIPQAQQIVLGRRTGHTYEIKTKKNNTRANK